ncbi:MAG: hypothetical protein RLZZ200_247 [Pseudomonadota bacterium]|jgi:hypothetical protein
MRRAPGWLWLPVAIATSVGAAEPDYPPLLPPDGVARQALLHSVGVQSGTEQLLQGAARRRKFRAGPYEWDAAAMTQDRKDASGAKYSEQQYELQRRFRFPGKGIIDRRLGDVARDIGDNAYADAWHESARGLLAEWFAWLRAEDAAALLAAQVDFGSREVDAVARRVARGDAARIDLQRVEVEQDRLLASQSEARRRAEEARLALLRDYPELDLVTPAHHPAPVAPQGSDEEWIGRIVAENHEIELAQGLADEAELAATRARRDRLPDPLIGLHYSDNIDQNRSNIGLRISIPLGVAARSADAAIARSQATIASAESAQVRRSVESTARLDVLNARSMIGQWERLSSAAAKATAAADALGRAYEAGEIGVAELIAARRQQLDAKLESGAASYAAHESLARLRLDAHLVWAPSHEEGKPGHRDH